MAKREGLSTDEFNEILNGLVHLDSEQNQIFTRDNHKKIKEIIDTTVRVLKQTNDLKNDISSEAFINK
jgi:hypothetical protein